MAVNEIEWKTFARDEEQRVREERMRAEAEAAETDVEASVRPDDEDTSKAEGMNLMQGAELGAYNMDQQGLTQFEQEQQKMADADADYNEGQYGREYDDAEHERLARYNAEQDERMQEQRDHFAKLDHARYVRHGAEHVASMEIAEVTQDLKKRVLASPDKGDDKVLSKMEKQLQAEKSVDAVEKTIAKTFGK